MNTTQKIHMIKLLNTPPEDFLVFRTTLLLCIHFKIWKRKVCAVCVVFVKACTCTYGSRHSTVLDHIDTTSWSGGITHIFKTSLVSVLDRGR